MINIYSYKAETPMKNEVATDIQCYEYVAALKEIFWKHQYNQRDRQRNFKDLT